MKPERVELIPLLREVIQLRAEWDILKKPWSTSQKRPCEIHLYHDTSRNLDDGLVARGARGLADKLLRLADQTAEYPGEGQRSVTDVSTSRFTRERPYLWSPAYLLQSSSRRGLLGQTSD